MVSKLPGQVQVHHRDKIHRTISPSPPPTIHALRPNQVRNTVGNRNSAQPMRNCSMHPIDYFVLLGGGLGWGLFGFLLFSMCSHQVLNEFSTCFSSSHHVRQHVPNNVPQHVPISTFILSHMLGPMLSSWNPLQVGQHYWDLYVWSEYFYIWRVSKVSNLIGDGQSKKLITKN